MRYFFGTLSDNLGSKEPEKKTIFKLKSGKYLILINLYKQTQIIQNYSLILIMKDQILLFLISVFPDFCQNYSLIYNSNEEVLQNFSRYFEVLISLEEINTSKSVSNNTSNIIFTKGSLRDEIENISVVLKNNKGSFYYINFDDTPSTTITLVFDIISLIRKNQKEKFSIYFENVKEGIWLKAVESLKPFRILSHSDMQIIPEKDLLILFEK